MGPPGWSGFDKPLQVRNEDFEGYPSRKGRAVTLARIKKQKQKTKNKNITLRLLVPTDPFAISELHNPSHDVPELNRIC